MHFARLLVAPAAEATAPTADVHKPLPSKDSVGAKKTFRQFVMRTLSTFLNYQIGGIIWYVPKGSFASDACSRI